MRVPPSGRQVVITWQDQRAVLAEVGGGLRTYEAGGRAVVDGYGEDEMCSGGRGQPLMPWPNRLEDGSYEWEGERHQLPISEPATSTAIHGLTRWSAWEVAEATTDSATLAHRLHPQPGYPWTLDLSLRYALGAGGLEVVLSAVNRSAGAAPFGAGFHPYLWAWGDTVDGCTLRVPAATAYEKNDRGLPTGKRGVEGTDDDYRAGRLIGERALDLTLTDLERDPDGRAVVELAGAGRARVWLDEGFTHVQVFSGDTLEPARRRQGLAVEPMTGPANLLATGDSRLVLEPGVPFVARWGIEPG